MLYHVSIEHVCLVIVCGTNNKKNLKDLRFLGFKVRILKKKIFQEVLKKLLEINSISKI